MTEDCVVYDKTRGIEIQLGQSKAEPTKVNVLIFAVHEYDVQLVIDELSEEYGCVEFTLPVRAADERYCSMGRVWN